MDDEQEYFGIWFCGGEGSPRWCCLCSHDISQLDCFETAEEAARAIETAALGPPGDYEVRPLPKEADAVRLRRLIKVVRSSLEAPKDLLPPDLQPS